MRRGRRQGRQWRPWVAGGVVVAAAAGYAWFVPVHAADTGRLRTLVPARPPAGYSVRPVSASPVPVSQTGLAAVTGAAKATPTATGAYSAQWRRRGSATAPAEVLVALLPSSAAAAATRSQALRRYLGSSALKSSGATRTATFTVAAAGHAPAAVFASPGTGASSTATAVAVVRHGRAVAVVLAAATGGGAPSTARGRLAAVATAEERTLSRTEPTLSLDRTTFPAMASAVYGGVALAVVAALYLVPGAVDRVRARRQAARARAAERARRARGRKVVRRQSAITGRRR